MYSPEIKPEKVRQLYQLKLRTGKQMTRLVDEAVEDYLAKHKDIVQEETNNGPQNRSKCRS